MSDAGTLTVDLASAGTLNPAMYLRASCDDSTTALWCNDFSTTLRTRKLHMDAGTYSLFVDGAGMTSGAYTLTLNLEPAACGDGVINPNTSEQCDDGNMDTGDGCDNCVLEPGSNDDCSNPLGPVVIQPSMPVTLSGTTTGNADNSDFVVAMQGCPANGNFLGGRDRVYALVPTAPGTMTIDIGYPLIGGTQGVCELTPTDPGCWNSVLYVRHVSGQSDQTACETQLSQVACEHQVVPNDSTGTASFTVEAGETYFVFVDSWWYDAAGGYTGPYWLHVNLQ
jgi:cysteine-rich repeat protein